jgi:GR25 family glycosyltransferase involved in LPS biosynthesis
LESDSEDRTYQTIEENLPQLRSQFRRVELYQRDFNFKLTTPRWEPSIQIERRTILAKSRNFLLSKCLQDEEWVMWLDVDVCSYPTEIIHQLLAVNKQIITPECVLADTDRSYDLNTFKLTDAEIDWAPHTIDGVKLPPKGAGRRYLQDFRDRDLVEVDSVGTTMLLVKADLHREGLNFPAYSYKGHLESEGLAMMAKDMGVSAWALPNVQIVHVNDAVGHSPPPANIICGLWIDLDRATVRRQELERQLEVAGLAGEYQRVAGVEGSQVAPHIARPGVIGCWLSHLGALERGRASGKVVHILEDDTLLGDRAQELFHALASSPTVLKYDLVFTDVLLDYFTTQHYFKAFAETAGQVQPGEIPAYVHAIDLREILFAGTNSYFISPDRIGTVLDLLNHTYQHLDPHKPEPIDMAMRRLVRTGKLSAAVTCPFLTSYHLDALADSQIDNNADSDLNHTRWLHTIHRQAFFYGADDRALLTQLEAQFPTQLSSDKSRLLGLLYEQFLIQSQKSF